MPGNQHAFVLIGPIMDSFATNIVQSLRIGNVVVSYIYVMRFNQNNSNISFILRRICNNKKYTTRNSMRHQRTW